MLVLIGGEVSESTIHDKPSLHTINVYDIASSTWFTQETSPASNGNSTPSDSGRTGHCAVAASARDNSSHNIYMYGGQTGPTVHGDMWILSLPSFTWIGPVSMGGMDVVGRSTKLDLHRCAVMQNRYMVVYQGRDWDAPEEQCNPHNGVRLFDLQAIEWTTRYEFSNDQVPYKVPKVVYDVVGGDENGGTTLTLPQAHVDPTLKEILAPQTTTTSTPTEVPEPSPDPVPSVGVIVGSILGGLIALGVLILLVVYLRRRSKRRARAESDGTEYRGKPELEAVVPQELASRQVQPLPGFYNPAQDIVPVNFEPVEFPHEDVPRVYHELPGARHSVAELQQ
ncbi:hypothetical protein BDZ91DRAFT_853067 [Kalaharituber pfeilii]|nr:hypothetical protein BDZ91DRAFT_853067 [Kalaharituber pfeilii]